MSERQRKPFREHEAAALAKLYRKSEWILSDWFCPECGQRDMWQITNQGGGDYYHDLDVQCHSCKYTMCCVGEVRDEPAEARYWWDDLAAAQASREPASVAAVDPHASSTGKTSTRDPLSPSSSSSSIPSPRTVTRYTIDDDVTVLNNEDGVTHLNSGCVVMFASDVEPILSALAEAEQEICICAAIRTKDGQIVRGHRHPDCFANLAQRTPKPEIDHEAPWQGQGFVTSKNRFVDRAEGMQLMAAAGTYSAHTGLSLAGVKAGTPLFSEDLY